MKSQSSPSTANTNAGNPLGIAPTGRLLAKFAIPAIISMLVNALYNIVDQIFIGQGVDDLHCCRTAAWNRRRLQLQP